jgi:hypothetical protein
MCEQCCICLENIDKKNNISILPCNHIIHTTCLCENIKFKRYNCPLCIKKIINNDEEILSEVFNNQIQLALDNEQRRIKEYKYYPILQKIYKEILEYKKLLKISKKNIKTLETKLKNDNQELLSNIKEEKKKYKSFLQKYNRREIKFNSRANQLLNINE